MRDEARSAIAALEAASGRPVVVQADPSLKLMAAMRLARGTAPAHIVLYQPALEPLADYLVAFQCGLALRTFAVPEADRFDVASTQGGRDEAGRLVAQQLKQSGLNLPPQTQTGLRDQLYDGVVLQLRSMPLSLRVDVHLRSDCPALAGLQGQAVARQLSENLGSLSPQVRQIAPKKILDASLSMNSAFAAFWGRVLGDPTLITPYRAGGYSSAGEELLRQLDEIPADPANDRKLIDTWATRLGLRPWFEFIPFGSR